MTQRSSAYTGRTVTFATMHGKELLARMLSTTYWAPPSPLHAHWTQTSSVTASKIPTSAPHSVPLNLPLTGRFEKSTSQIAHSECAESEVGSHSEIESITVPRQVGIGANGQYLQAWLLYELVYEFCCASDERRVEVDLGCEYPRVIIRPHDAGRKHPPASSYPRRTCGPGYVRQIVGTDLEEKIVASGAPVQVEPFPGSDIMRK